MSILENARRAAEDARFAEIGRRAVDEANKIRLSQTVIDAYTKALQDMANRQQYNQMLANERLYSGGLASLPNNEAPLVDYNNSVGSGQMPIAKQQYQQPQQVTPQPNLNSNQRANAGYDRDLFNGLAAIVGDE